MAEQPNLRNSDDPSLRRLAEQEPFDTSTETRHVVMMSGGVDSFALAYAMANSDHRGQTRYFYAALPSNKAMMREYQAVCAQSRLLEIVPQRLQGSAVPTIDQYGFIPHRNVSLILGASCSAVMADVLDGPAGLWKRLPKHYNQKIWLAGLKDDRVPDNTADFFSALSQTLSLSAGFRVQVSSPFRQKTKKQVIGELAQILGWDVFEDAMMVWSCYEEGIPLEDRPDDDPQNPVPHSRCGWCRCCFRFWIALEAAWRPPAARAHDTPPRPSMPPFTRNPWEGPVAREYAGKMRADDCQYDEERQRDTLAVLESYGL